MRGFVANGLAFVTWFGVLMYYIGLGLYSGHDMRTVADAITLVGTIMGFACAWWVWSLLKSEGKFPYWISSFVALGIVGTYL